MILSITIVFCLLVLILPLNWGIGLSLSFQFIYFQLGNIDVSSIGFFLVMTKLIITGKINLGLYLKTYNSIKLFFLIFIVSFLWSFSWDENTMEFLLSNLRILIVTLGFSYFLSKERNNGTWLLVLFLPFILFTFHNYLLFKEWHPFYETYKEYGRLSARTITGDFLNSNLAAYSLFIVFVLYLIRYKFEIKQNNKFNKRVLLILGFLVLVSAGYLGSRSIIISILLLLPILLINIKYLAVICFLIFPLLFFIDLSSFEVPFVGDLANDRLRLITTEEISKESEMSRALLFSKGFDIFLDNFIFGVGTGKVMETMSQNNYLGEPMMTHNVYLDFAIQFGTFGILISIWILYFGYKMSKSNLDLGYIFLCSVILPNLSHDYFLISLTPILFVMMEFYSKVGYINIQNNAK